jgi:hypothetical protein
MEQSAPTRQVSSSVTPEQRVRCSQLLNFQNKEGSNHSIQLRFLSPPDRQMHPMLHEYKEKRAAFPGGKGRRGVVFSEAPPRLVQELGGRISVRL